MKNSNIIFLFILGISLLMVLIPGPVYAEENAKQTTEGVLNLNRFAELKTIQARNEEAVFNVPGVVGMGIGLTEDGKVPAFVVYCKKLRPESRALFPHHLEGVPVRLIESGVFRAY